MKLFDLDTVLIHGLLFVSECVWKTFSDGENR